MLVPSIVTPSIGVLEGIFDTGGFYFTDFRCDSPVSPKEKQYFLRDHTL